MKRAISLIALSSLVFAQSPSQNPAFEVAAIQPSPQVLG
jgi:hypothetical protein